MAILKRIVRDPEICGGQPTIKGTRVLVTDILDFLKDGASFQEILESFPTITKEDIVAILEYSEMLITGETIVYTNQGH